MLNPLLLMIILTIVFSIIFRFEGVECDFTIEAARLAEIDARIAANYRIPQLRFLADKGKEQE